MDSSAKETASAATPLSSFDWSQWEDWTQWDEDTDLLNSPGRPVTEDTGSYPDLVPEGAREAVYPSSSSSSGAGRVLGHGQVPLDPPFQWPKDLTTPWTEEFLNLDSLGEAPTGLIRDMRGDSQEESSPSDSIIHFSDFTRQSQSSTASDSWSPLVPLPSPSQESLNRKRKSSASKEDDESTSGGRRHLPRAKMAHNIVEKRYRTNLNDKIDALRDILPNLQTKHKACQRAGNNEQDDEYAGGDTLFRDPKANKAAVLTEAIDYIRQLEERLKQQDEQMSVMQMRLDVFKKLAAARSSEVETGVLQVPPQWRGIRDNATNLPYQANSARPSQASALGRNVRPAAQQNASRGGYMSRLMVGSLAGLMVMHGLGESSQTGDPSADRGLFSLPTQFIWQIKRALQALDQSGASKHALLVRNFGVLFKVLLLLGAVIFILSPSFFDSTPKEEAKPPAQLALVSAPPPGSPVEVRRSAWLTAIQTVWVPRQSLLQQLAALLLKAVKVGIRRTIGGYGYAILTRTTEEQEVVRVRAWDIALDAQLTGGDAEINLRRLALTLLASETLPVTPYHLMRKALHIHVLLWGITTSRLRGRNLYRSLAKRFARYQWDKARELQRQRAGSPLPVNGPPGSDTLPSALASLLELDIDTVMQDSVVQRACNLAWDRPTSDKTLFDCVSGMETIINDPAIGSPLDALSAWCSCDILHKALVNFLAVRTGVAGGSPTFQHHLDIALNIAPIGSLVQSHCLVARTVLLEENRGTNIAAALQSLPQLWRSGNHTPTASAPATVVLASDSLPPPTTSELAQALQCTMAVALLKREQYRHDAVALMRTIQLSSNDFGLLGLAAAYVLLDAVFRDRPVDLETRGVLENISGPLKIWISGTRGRNCGLGTKVRSEIAKLSVDVLSWLVGMRDKPLDDPGYGSMSDG